MEEQSVGAVIMQQAGTAHHHDPREFPKGFLWGTATSSYQVEGGNTNCDWATWERTPGRIARNEAAGLATDHFRRYKEDFTMAADLGYNSQRLSIEWSRIEPRPGEWDQAAFDVYKDMLRTLRAKGMKTMVTLWHFTLPQWFADRGGWLASDAVERFLTYVDVVSRELCGLVDIWITMNEPMVYVAQGYQNGVWPPGEKSAHIHATRVVFRLIKAHRKAYAIIHRHCDRIDHRTEVGTANNIFTFDLYRKHSIVDSMYIWFADNIINHQFVWWTRKTIDFVGVNYYFHHRLAMKPQKISEMFSQVKLEGREVSDIGWEVNPAGIFDALLDMARYNKPIYITENGIASADDSKRARTIIATVKEIYHAIHAGVDVRGYFHWSLLDNYEWEKGFAPRFGLVEVDYATQKRTPRHSAEIYGQIARENGLRHELLRFLGHGVK